MADNLPQIRLTDQFYENIRRGVLENEDFIREQAERELLEGRRITMEDMGIDIDGFDKTDMDSKRELRQKLDEKVTQLLNALYNNSQIYREAGRQLEQELNSTPALASAPSSDNDDSEEEPVEVNSVNDLQRATANSGGSMTGGQALQNFFAFLLGIMPFSMGISFSNSTSSIVLTWAAIFVGGFLGVKVYRALKA